MKKQPSILIFRPRLARSHKVSAKKRCCNMTTQEGSKLERKLRRLELARVLLGVAGIVAVFAVVLCGVDAFTKERDAGLAMRLPFAIAVLLLWGFARCAKAILALQAILRR